MHLKYFRIHTAIRETVGFEKLNSMIRERLVIFMKVCSKYIFAFLVSRGNVC